MSDSASSGWLLATLSLALIPLASTPPLTSAGPPARCGISEGTQIRDVQIGMPVAAALAATGPAVQERTAGSQVTYVLRSPWSQMMADRGVVQRVSTQSSECRTAQGIGPGSTLSAVRAAYASASISIMTPLQNGDLLSYPFGGVAFVIRRDRVQAVEVFRAETAPAAQPVPPSPAPALPSPGTSPRAAVSSTSTTAPRAWSIRSTTGRVEGSSLIVSGTVENRSRPQSAYAEVRASNSSGQPAAQDDAPLFPNPVPAGGSATFEVRLAINEVVRRYTVTIRPVGSISVSLAEGAGEIRDLQAFASIVARQIQAAVQTINTPPTRDDFVVVVTNNSPLVVASVTVAIEIIAVCRVVFPVPRSVQEVRSGTAFVQHLRPGATARAPIPLSQGICTEFATWSAQSRIGEVRIGD